SASRLGPADVTASGYARGCMSQLARGHRKAAVAGGCCPWVLTPIFRCPTRVSRRGSPVGSHRARRSGFDEPRADGVPREFEPVLQAEFLQEIGPVPLHGLRADVEQVGDLLARVAFGDEVEDLLLAVGDRLV